MKQTEYKTQERQKQQEEEDRLLAEMKEKWEQQEEERRLQLLQQQIKGETTRITNQRLIEYQQMKEKKDGSECVSSVLSSR